ncbi:hypothetical protein JCM10908_004641 [Rhodotorula pacifica]|uniref:uncharacterized protein n=1 Tax=Rhodotorula pacifica TaxID=1495444 RepID=UPI00317CB817
MATRAIAKGAQTARPALRPRLVPATAPRRFASSYIPHLEPKPKRGIKIGYVFATFVALGIGATSMGLWQYYQSFTAYPDSSSHPIRSKLRAALRLQQSGDYARASAVFEQAYQLALDLFQTGQLAPGPEEALLRLSGIAVRWGGLWEEAGDLARAVEIYDTGFQPVAAAIDGFTKNGQGVAPTRKQVQRGAGIAMKLGDLWVQRGGGSSPNSEAISEAERYYSWAVQELMRLNLTDKQREKVKAQLSAQEEPLKVPAPAGVVDEDDADLKLPGWVGEVELVAAMERLGDLYSRTGKIEYAQPLLQQAIAILIPPPPKEGPRPPLPPIPQRCHAATLMNNLSSALVSAPSPSKAAIEASAKWAKQSLVVANGCRREAAHKRGDKSKDKSMQVPLAEKEERECELTAIVSSYNLGKLCEMAKDPVEAEQWFVQSGRHAESLGLQDAVVQSNEAIRRLKRPAGTQ